MDQGEIQNRVETAWRIAYPDDGGSVLVTEIVPNVFGGFLAAIRSEDSHGNKNEELVYLFTDSRVKIFPTTEELARFLEARSKSKIVEYISDTSFITGVVFLFLIFAIFIVGYKGENYSAQALTALSSVLGAAAGFFFATKKPI